MLLQELNSIEKNKYDHLIAAHNSGSFLQSWQWGQWQESLGQKAHRFFVKDNDEILLATQVIKTFIPRLKKYYLYIPYGPLVRVEGSGVRGPIMDFFLGELIKKFPDAIFIRIEPKQDFQLSTFNFQLTSHIQPGKTLALDLTKTEEELLSEMHPKTRYNIKVAAKHEVKVQSELVVTPGYGLHLKEALDLLIETSKRQKYKAHGKEYYKKLIDFFGTQNSSDFALTVYKAFSENKLLACAVMIDFVSTRTYLFGGTSQQDKNLMAPYALHWQAIKEAKAKGLPIYDFWGIETAKGDTPGFVRFKLGFGGREIQYPHASEIILKPVWYNLYKVLRYANRKLIR